jgi:hypothetical protein
MLRYSLFPLLFISLAYPDKSLLKSKQQEEKPRLELIATKSALLSPDGVEFIGKIIGNIDWCPDEIVWVWSDGFSREEVDCDKVFSRYRKLTWGKNRIWLKVYSEHKLMGVEYVDVMVGG